MKNRYEIRGDTVAIVVTDQRGVQYETLVSLAKLPKLLAFNYTWRALYDKKRDYVRVYCVVKEKTVYLHRWIIDAAPGKVVDHKYGDPLDNRDGMLREITNAENLQNRKGANRNSTTGVRGVYYREHAKKYAARARLLGKDIHIGYFDTITEAEVALVTWRKVNMPYSVEKGA